MTGRMTGIRSINRWQAVTLASFAVAAVVFNRPVTDGILAEPVRWTMTFVAACIWSGIAGGAVRRALHTDPREVYALATKRELMLVLLCAAMAYFLFATSLVPTFLSPTTGRTLGDLLRLAVLGGGLWYVRR